jgi:hypothetical protein
MAKRTTTAKAKRPAKPRVEKHSVKSKQSQQSHPSIENTEVARDDVSDQGAPIEHFRGERNRGQHTGDAGSLDEETLDRAAPYNRTYGRVAMR